jgi:putative ABC transport system substrate-binding protein
MRPIVFLAAALGLCGLGEADAQEPGRVYRLGLVSPSTFSAEGFRRHSGPELAKLGFVEGRNLEVITHVGRPEDLPALARDLVAGKPDAIIAVSSSALAATKAATDTIPIVAYGPDAVAQGFAASFSRPAGNVTGVVILGGDLDAKRLDLLREAVPTAKRIAVLYHPSNALVEGRQSSVQAVAQHGAIVLLTYYANGAADYDAVIAKMRVNGAQSLVIAAHPLFYLDGAVLSSLAREADLPTICQWREMAEAGCLIGYGPSQPELRRRLANSVAQILRGVSPAEIPIEQPTKLELAINLKTAKALGLTIPETFLLRADEVIE